MDSQRLLLVPRSFIYAVEETRAPCGFRLAFVNTMDPSDTDARFFLNISDVSAGRIIFTFLNTTPEDFAITHVYFDDGELMAINVVREPVNDSQTAVHARKVAVAGGSGYPAYQSLHENLAVTFDLHAGIGMADIVCALNNKRLKVSLKALRPGSEEIEIFTSDPELSLTPV